LGTVDRCVCKRVMLSAVAARAVSLRASGLKDEDGLVTRLAEEMGCTTGCGMCEAYVRLTLRTGRGWFDWREPAARAAVSEVEARRASAK
jgi:uncharacterized Fe-S cluster-containing radical SAM superfamily protein